MRSEWLGSLLAKGFYIKASFPYLWIIDATLCHIVRWKDQLVEGQTWIEIGLKEIGLKDRIFVPLSFRTTCEWKQTNPSSFLKRKNPISKIWPSTDYIIKQSIASYCFQLLQNIQGRKDRPRKIWWLFFLILKELFAINFNRSKFVRSAYATKVCHEMGYIEDTLNITTRSKPIKSEIILVGWNMTTGWAESISGIGVCVWLCVSVITSKMIIISARRLHRPL